MRSINTCLFLFLSMTFMVTFSFGQDTLKTVEYDIDGCINLYSIENRSIVTNREELDAVIRNDARRKQCVKSLKKFDIEHYSLIGTNLNSGHCRYPAGLKFTVRRFDLEKKYKVEITYDPVITPCCARSSYDLWLKVPAIPEGYEVEFVN